MEILELILIGVGLSMDSFSLSLCYGTLNLGQKKMNLLSLIVGVYHFFMPLLGALVGHGVGHYISIDMRYVVFIIFMILGLEMINGVIKKETNTIMLNSIGLLLFGFTVSVDSFSAGIGIEFISNKHLLCSIIFAITSYLFTYAGLQLGTVLNNKFKDFSKLAGGIILMLFALYYLFK